jgi:exopolysaccharide biosynthesis polyprenyl glycosylphosphotransferase
VTDWLPRVGRAVRADVGLHRPKLDGLTGDEAAGLSGTVRHPSDSAGAAGPELLGKAREDTPMATTGLQAPGLPSSNAKNGWRASDAVHDGHDDQPPVDGVPRNATFQRHKRISTWHRQYVVALIGSDLLAALLASFVTIALVRQLTLQFAHLLGFFYTLSYLLLPLGWMVTLWAHGCYDRRYLGIGTDEFKRVTRASVTMMATLSFLGFAFVIQGNQRLSRVSVAVAVIAGLVFVLLLRFVARRVLHGIRGKGGASHRLLLVGTLSETIEVHTAVTRTQHAGMVPIAIHLTEGRPTTGRRPAPVPVFAGRDILGLVQEIGADTVAVCGSASADRSDLRRLAWQLEGTGVDLVVAPQLTDIAGPRVHIRPVEGLPLLYVEEPKLAGFSWLVKNVMDRTLAALGLLVAMPLFLVISLGIRLSDRGPIFFRQRRAGREGEIFSVWKFRTMYVDAEERRATLNTQNETNGMLFKIKRDPRVFTFGRWLRASSLDELPQLINVLRGDMSLVGPRPLPAEDGDFLGDVRRRLLVRPGMTGLWQVSGRSDLSWDDAVRLDLYYVDNWSLAFDLTILWRTVGVVLRSKGAY